MPSKLTDGEQPPLRAALVIGEEDSRLLEELARFAERASHDNARAALVFMAYVFRDAHRRYEQSG